MALAELDRVAPEQRELLPGSEGSDARTGHHATLDAARPIWVRLAARLMSRLLRRQEIAAARRRLRELAEEPGILDDVGMSRADALLESCK
jgi:hypothetical protein